jgi:hypothetical protein
LLSGLSKVAGTLADMLRHATTTLARMLAGFAPAVGILMGRMRGWKAPSRR